MERRRERNREAQRRRRQRQQQLAENTIHLQYSFSDLGPAETIPAVAIPEPPGPSTSAASAGETSAETRPPEPVPGYGRPSPTARKAGAPKTFCDTIADGVNLVLDGIGTIDMDGVQLPNPYTRQHLDAISIQSYQSSISPGTTSTSVTSDSNESTSRDPATSGGWMNPLHLAARKGHTQILQSLLEHNANCNLSDSEGLTPLLHATIGGFADTVTVLLSHGASTEQTDPQRRSALHWAVIEKQEAALKVLLEHGAMKAPFMTNRCDERGRTPLHLAVGGDFDAGVQLLLRFGANVHAQGRYEAR